MEQRETLARWREFPGLERAPAGGAAVALTFDDGPDPEGTPAVLDALDAAAARATFFMVGEQLMRNIALGRQIVERGHEVALHGFTHLSHDDMTPTAARDDPARGLGTLEAGTGTRPHWYRPPYGRFSEHSYAACAKLQLEPVYWSAWGGDWDDIPPERIAELAARDLADGAILVLHDSARYSVRPSALPTAAAVPLIAERVTERGLRLLPLGEVAAPRR